MSVLIDNLVSTYNVSVAVLTQTKRTRMKKLFPCVAAILLFACSPTPPPSVPPPPPPPPPPVVDMAVSPAPRIVSVTPTTVKINADTKISIVGSGLSLDQSQPGIWSFGVCQINAYTYTPVDINNGSLLLQVPGLNPGPCDLTLTKNGQVLATLKAAFTLVP